LQLLRECPRHYEKLDEAFRKAMDDPEFISYMEKVEYEPPIRNAEDTRKYLEEAYVRVGK